MVSQLTKPLCCLTSDLFCSQFFRSKLLVHGLHQQQSKAKKKMDLPPNVFNADTLNNYLAFRYNVGLPSSESDWSRCPTHCLDVCTLAHRQASVQVLGIGGGVIPINHFKILQWHSLSTAICFIATRLLTT